jgi:ABC-2 type transport system ATP-binding protein
MKQKLALACTLIHEPAVLLLDEPTTGVDPVSRREFWKLLSEFLASGITILMSTPYLDEAERCTRVALVHEGRVLAADEPSRLRNLIPGRMLEVLLPGTDAARPRGAARPQDATDTLRALPGVRDAQVFGERIHITLDESGTSEERFRAALRATPLADALVRQVQPSLEDVFIARLSGTEDARA